MPTRGRLTDWDDDRGFGHIKPLDGAPAVFVHVSEFPRDKRRPIATDLLTFDVGIDQRGRTHAVNVQFLSAAHARSERAVKSGPSSTACVPLPVTFAAAGSLLSTVLLAALGIVAWLVPVVYLTLSLAAFAAYGWDKMAAEAGRWRTSEATLIGIGLLGGWPGALVAQEYFRHKTRKQPFRTAFFLSIAVNVAVLTWIVATTGTGTPS